MAEAIPQSEFQDRILPRLRALRRRLRWYLAAEGLALLSVAVLGCFIVQLGLDYVFRLRVDLRAGLLASLVVFVGAVCWRRLIRPLIAQVGVDDIAAVVERRFPDVQSQLISAVQFTAQGARTPRHHSRELIQQVIGSAVRRAGSLPLEAILNHHRVKRHLGLLCSVFAVALACTLIWPETIGVWFQRNILLGHVAWKQQTYLTVLNDEDRDGIIVTPRGDDLEIRVRAAGKRPDHVRIDFDFSETQKSESHNMTAVGTTEFRFTLPNVRQPLSFRARGNDADVGTMQVRLVERPRISDARITVFPPAYTRQEPYQLRSGKTLIEVLTGSEIQIEFRTNKPVSQAQLLQDHQEFAPVILPEVAGYYTTRFTPKRNATYAFNLLDEAMLANINPRQFLVRLQSDAAPNVSLHVRDAGELITRRAALALEMSFKDRFGLASAELRITAGEETESEPTRVPLLESGSHPPQLTTTYDLDLAEREVEEGERLHIEASACDQNDVNGPGCGTSSRFAFRIVSPEELLAELSRREQEFRQEFERLIDMQEDLRNELLSMASRASQNQNSKTSLTVLERRQRQLVRQTSHIRSQFQRIYAELVINRLDSEQVRERLLEGIVDPLESLSNRPMGEAVSGLEQLRRHPEPAMYADMDRRQALIVERMRVILSNMTRWEGFQETISMLQAIIKMQDDLAEETDETLVRQLEKIFKKE